MYPDANVDWNERLSMSREPIEAVLESALSSYQLRVEIITSARYCGDWVDHEPETARGQFHLIEEGQCLVSGSCMRRPIVLSPGDFIVFPRGAAHRLSACTHTSDEALRAGDVTTILCGELQFISGQRNPIFAALPDYFVVQDVTGGGIFRSLARSLTSISSSGSFGYQVVRNKLADSLFTMAVLDYARHAGDAKGIFAALADRRIALALSAIHSNPGHNWSLHALASITMMSRTSFAGRFSELMGLPPMQYLAHWRVTEAQRLLQDRSISVATIAETLGYQSEPGFRRFFKRIVGIGPGEVRAQGRRTTAPESLDQ